MGIIINESMKLFHLQSGTSSYIFRVTKEGYLNHLYYGKKIHTPNPDHLFEVWGRASFSPTPSSMTPSLTLDDMPIEYPTYGQSDFRVPALSMVTGSHDRITSFIYKDYELLDGKPPIKGLPATYVEDPSEAATLKIILEDEKAGLEVALFYTVFNERGVITRHTQVTNNGSKSMSIERLMSTALDFESRDFDVLYLHGAWARERHIERKPLTNGIFSIDSKRGSSSHQRNPFVALLSKETTEDHGEAFGFSLVYSGNHLTEMEVDQFANTRLVMGLNPFGFEWKLEPGSTFSSPECVMVYSSEGMGEMSRTYHRLYRTRLARGVYRDQVRPILVNNWEGTYFDFNEEKLLSIAKEGKALGLELFVLDDGWFGKRNDDKSSLGDWFVNLDKLPGGLESVAKGVNDLGMKFGLWFEPEMISPDSDLYRQHPDWCLHVDGRSRTLGRNQLILDMSRQDVRDYLIKTISAMLASVNISYVKWDMNRNMTEIGSAFLPEERQKETAHRYMLGLYEVMEKITSAFPDVLFESCSGGGGRFDPGILYYMPQTWTSDDTDAVERLKIQYGTSMVYPISSMGAHVSAVPNHQVHRTTSLKMRGDVAMSGNFGYELDLSTLSEIEKEEMKIQVSKYKALRSLIQFGDFYRLLSPFEGDEAAWMVVSEDKTQAFVAYFRVLAKPNDTKRRLCLKGLKADGEYTHENEAYYGDELMYAGLAIPYVQGDFTSFIWHLKLK